MLIVSIIAVVALIAAGTIIYVVSRPDSASAGEVFLDAADQPGPDPFTTQVSVATLPSTTTTTAAPAATAGGTASTVGSRPGLYGGTRNAGSCDPNQMITFLQANPDKAGAWVSALNGDPTLRWTGGNQVQVNQIPAYIRELTPITLTVDTRVTNYGYAKGRPTPRQAVLQRGTAVLVDAYGVPRVKCGCGNPLTRPVAVKGTPTYQGPTWPGWSPTTVIVVQQTTVVVNTFVIVNLDGSGYLDRPAGTTGDRDTTSTYTGDDTTSTTTPTSTEPPSTAPVPTLAPSDFCAEFQTAQAKWGNASAETPAQLQELAADLDRLAAAAPAEIKAAMQIVADGFRQALANNSLNADVPAEVTAAEAQVSAYLTNVCGIAID
jgi:hypothetical protein